ncbi:hypothetical protein [Propionicimonas sp.]|uniref:hypothetical protein n=1 Tax=Propionicimonas sp. TaxID=1955623 RepID=UPI0017CB5246|nr:hypothetical protein [Propionicimonas sp.]MBU3975745.1 hypothetical protein [Actinomycetota bacterium]MBA3019852.1 hypothetical protein [Propionicimonas sp.]MBU3986106.1 hypothetical protein [Actinomycetota bacterium]MBU4007461.1 hypothetical protein [Actinomycetota bacterium]MBU4063933.1 hypothetical protein [Actinomycetota bacterium]
MNGGVVRITSYVRKTALATAVLLVAGVGLIGPATQAHAVAGLSQVTLTSAKIAIPTGSATVTKLALGFAGPTDPTITYGATAKIKAVKSPIKKSKLKLPIVKVPATVAPGSAAEVQVVSYPNTSRGEYRVTVVITQRVNGVATNTATINSKVIQHHSAANSEILSKFSKVSYYYGAKSKLKVSALVPKYLAGAKVKIIFAQIDGSGMKTIGSGKVSSKGKIKITTKKIVVPSQFYLAFSVKGRAYIDAFTKWGGFQKA